MGVFSLCLSIPGNLLLFIFWDLLTVSLRLECGGAILAHFSLCILDSNDSPASYSQIAGIAGNHHHTRLIFVFLVETGFPPCCPGWSWTPDLRWSTRLGPSKCWDYRREPPRPAPFSHFLTFIFTLVCRWLWCFLDPSYIPIYPSCFSLHLVQTWTYFILCHFFACRRQISLWNSKGFCLGLCLSSQAAVTENKYPSNVNLRT